MDKYLKKLQKYDLDIFLFSFIVGIVLLLVDFWLFIYDEFSYAVLLTSIVFISFSLSLKRKRLKNSKRQEKPTKNLTLN